MGERGDAMYFISSGAVEVKLTTTPVQLGTGQFFGELALIDDRPRTSDVVSLGFCQGLLGFVTWPASGFRYRKGRRWQR